jgi:hypothetical protein
MAHATGCHSALGIQKMPTYKQLLAEKEALEAKLH